MSTNNVQNAPVNNALVNADGRPTYPFQAWLTDTVNKVNSISTQQGAKGDTGDKGDKGDKGDIGATGATGATGASGANGKDGATGAKGDTGDTGEQGIQGVQGIPGEKGDKGDTGLQGIQGVKGDTGSIGVKGDKGDTGSVENVFSPLVLDSDTKAISITPATATTNGYLSATDWNTFNNKQNAGASGSASQLAVYTTAQRLAITAVRGMICFDSDLAQMCVYTGSSWMAIPYAGMIIPSVYINNVPTNGLMPSQNITAPGVSVSTSVT